MLLKIAKVKIKEENEGGQQTVVTVGGNRQEKRKRIMSYFINATIELMEKEGIENLTIRKVAEQAKYNSATLYHYFSNLDELELFASVKCLDEYMQETLIHKAEERIFRSGIWDSGAAFADIRSRDRESITSYSSVRKGHRT